MEFLYANCSKGVIKIINKFENSTFEEIDKFIKELEDYKNDYQLNEFEESLLNHAISVKNGKFVIDKPTVHIFDPWENIRRIEKDYNGDPFTYDGYEFFTEDGRRY